MAISFWGHKHLPMSAVYESHIVLICVNREKTLCLAEFCDNNAVRLWCKSPRVGGTKPAAFLALPPFWFCPYTHT